MTVPEAGHDADDLRDFFAILYDGDDWAFDSDTELEEDKDGVKQKDGTGEEQQNGAGGADASGQAVVEDGGTLADGAPVSAVATTRQRYTRKRFTDQLDSLLYPSPKRSRIYSPPSRPSSSLSFYPSTLPLPPLPPSSTYAPFSPLALLARLLTFDTYTFSSSIPQPLSPRAVASYGWTAGGLGPADTLHCGLCGAKWDLRGVSEIADTATRAEVAKRLDEKGARKRQHRKGCAWKVNHSPDELYAQLRRMVHPPTVANLGLLKAALEEECEGLDRIRWTSPLSEETLRALASSLRPSISSKQPPSMPASSAETDTPSALPAALALFAWYPYHPNDTSTHVTISPSSTYPAEPTSPRAPDSAPTTATSQPPPYSPGPRGQTSIVQCRICERRVGLWAFIPTTTDIDIDALAQRSAPAIGRRTFDLVDEHEDWCPVKNDTSAHSLPSDGIEKVGGEAPWWSGVPFLSSDQSDGSYQSTEMRRGQEPGQDGKKERFRVSDRLVPKPWRRR